MNKELSEKNQYYLEKHRYLELQHFCLQYPIWNQMYNSISAMATRPIDKIGFDAPTGRSPTQRCADALIFLKKRMELVIDTAEEAAGKELKDYIIQSVITGQSYDQIRAFMGVPCCRDTFYKLRRKFFYILNKNRQ